MTDFGMPEEDLCTTPTHGLSRVFEKASESEEEGNVVSVARSVIAWSRTLDRVVGYGPGDSSKSILSDFYAPLAEADRRILGLLREGLPVKLIKTKSVDRVLVVDDAAFTLCAEQGPTLVSDLTIAFRDIDFVGIGPCTIPLRDSIKRHYGSLKSPDAIDHGKRVSSPFFFRRIPPPGLYPLHEWSYDRPRSCRHL